MLRLHLLQKLFSLINFTMEEALFNTPLCRTFAGLGNTGRLPDQVSILRFHHMMKKHNFAKQFFETVNDMLGAKGLMLKSDTVVDATISAAPSSTKNSTASVIRKCSKPRRPINGISEWRHILGSAPIQGWSTASLVQQQIFIILPTPAVCCTVRKKWHLLLQEPRCRKALGSYRYQLAGCHVTRQAPGIG